MGDVGEIGVDRPDVALRVLEDQVAPANRCRRSGLGVMNCDPRAGLPNTSSDDGRSAMPASAASLD